METTSETARKKQKVNDENVEYTNSTLPEEIVTDIISRLPVKHVFQLQCLSKNFSSITNDLYFISVHLGFSARLRPSVILNKGNDIYLIQSNGLDSETIIEEVPLRRIINLTDSTEKLTIEASCNGLVIFRVGDRDCFIWNPATTQCNSLPNSRYVGGLHLWTSNWGLGYCTESRQYKIVRIQSYDSYASDGDNIQAEILSYGTDCEWRRLDFSKFDALCMGPGTTVKGVVYWTLMDDYKLLSFDLEKEEFAWIMCPLGGFEKLMEFQGSLAACRPSGINEKTYGFNEKTYDIYVLKDAGNAVSWERIYTTGDIFPSVPVKFLNGRQLFLVNKGEKVVFDRCATDGVSCSLYDLESEEIKKIPQALVSIRSDVLNFVESMVPLLPIGF